MGRSHHLFIHLVRPSTPKPKGVHSLLNIILLERLVIMFCICSLNQYITISHRPYFIFQIGLSTDSSQSIHVSIKSPSLPPLTPNQIPHTLPQTQIMFTSQVALHNTYTFRVVNKWVSVIIAHSYIHKIIQPVPPFLLLTTLCSLKRAK